MGIILLAAHAGQALLAAKAGLASYTAITNLQQYEEPSKKAAQYVETAAQQLYKTRVTQASGALSLAASAITAVVLLVYSFTPTWLQLAFNLANAVATYAARAHISDFWQGKSQVPLVQGYNKGIQNSKYLVDQLGYLALSWLVTSLLTLIG